MVDETEVEELNTNREAYERSHAELTAQLEKLANNNVAIEQDLIKQRVQPNPYVIITMRLNLLLDRLLGDGESNARLAYEIESAKNIQAILMHIQQEKAKESKLIIPELRPIK